MTPEEFVDAVATEVRDSAAEGIELSLVKPAGRRPSQDAITMSKWYIGLGETDRRMVRSVIRAATHSAVFGFLAVLDGVRSIGDGSSGHLRLIHEQEGAVTILNDPRRPLHDILNAR